MAKAWVELERETLQSDTQQLPPLEPHVSSPLQLAPADSCKLHSGNVENDFFKKKIIILILSPAVNYPV